MLGLAVQAYRMRTRIRVVVATVPIPDLVSVGQSLDLLATVTNQGDVDALGVSLSPLTISGAGGRARTKVH